MREEKDARIIKREILPYLAPGIAKLLWGKDDKFFAGLEEIRLRIKSPLILKIGDRDYTINRRGEITTRLDDAYVVEGEDIYRSIASISDNSLYAFEEDIKKGFITIPGGHRVGLAGQVVYKGNNICILKNFSSICFRVAREIKGCAKGLLPYLIDKNGQIVNTLLISPPRCGKTTILRDLARMIADGIHIPFPHNVVIIDERSEIAGCYQGVPQLEVGVRTDVLDACPKALGMMMAIRSLSPEVIVTDEIGREEDIASIYECINAGVAVIATVHARNIEELERRVLFKELLKSKSFGRGVVLSRRQGPGTVEAVYRWDD
ncbi:stage III sporulation protein AA [Thermosyntropha lipolytica DSM 11003]|uniref:Stage III sporulation protein AA n=1 Tax=Thermosyntropha lipolytica DSM 11003 TaxID=1123382 RepID=A0A1M5LJR8_9FIRM|nr:stage III sporulation protein AA [Thermosyntropha lipolytica]SHG65362.1 stage III sporulation protein AA [Thermosyntropha lipolytica DSM 11003]